MIQLTYTCVALLIIYQIFVSFLVYRAEEYEKAQRLIQILLIWCIPLVAALIFHSFLRNQRKSFHGKVNHVVAQDQNIVLGYGDLKD
ncbi:hypothetical protein [Undibacterium danionis]|uniref:Cardiolipin synthase N-terminal domain-containing protein n=1 Tax=Undibacterium danionis TaxID=1812100 RepID=A0ABV6ICM1_9BURK